MLSTVAKDVGSQPSLYANNIEKASSQLETIVKQGMNGMQQVSVIAYELNGLNESVQLTQHKVKQADLDTATQPATPDGYRAQLVKQRECLSKAASVVSDTDPSLSDTLKTAVKTLDSVIKRMALEEGIESFGVVKILLETIL